MLIIVTTSFNFQQIPMMDRTACVSAAEYFKNNSNRIGILCVSSNTGEVVVIRDGNVK